MLKQLKRHFGFTWEDLSLVGNGSGKDFQVETSQGEYRFINSEIIGEVFHEECQQTIEDCYELNNVPSFVEIDWKTTTNNCLIDGYGHQFSSYDGEEFEVIGEDGHIKWYVFRTN